MKKILAALIVLIMLATPAFSQVLTNGVTVSYATATSPQTAQSDGGHGGAITVTPSSIVNVNTSPDWSFSAGALFMSKYYGTIFGGTFYDGPMSFWDITGIRKNSLGNFIACVSIGQKLDRLNTFNRDGGTEYDFQVDQTFKLGTEKFPVLVDVGATYLILTDIGHMADDALSETVRLDFPLFANHTNGPILQPYVQIYHYNTVGSGFRDEGFLGYFGLIRDQKLGFELFGNELKLNIDYRCGINFAVYHSHAGIEYHRLALSLPIKKGGWTITPSIIGQTPGGSGMTYVSKNEVFGTLSIRYSF